MKFFWIILVAYVALRMAFDGRRRSGPSLPGGGYGENNDKPRTAGRSPEARPQAARGGEMVAAGEDNDRPLQGPWSRRQEEAPGETAEIPPGTGKKGRYAAEAGSEIPSVEDPSRGDIPGAPFDLSSGDVPPAVRDAYVTDKNGPAGYRKAGRGSPLQGFFTPGGVYQGIIMAEILGSRGGRARRRQY